MRVVLLNPWQPVIEERAEHLGTFLPLACLYLASAAERAGHEVSVIDAFTYGCLPALRKNRTIRPVFYAAASALEDMEDAVIIGSSIPSVIGMIAKCEPEVIGISVTFSSLHYLLCEVIDMLRNNFPNVKIVIGGTHATLMPESVLTISGADYVITGEGEVSFVKLLNAIEKNEEPKNIPGVYYKKDDKIHSTPFEIIEDIDSIYPPMYIDVPLEYYFGIQGCKRAHMITSRGCPFNCTFCTAPLLCRRKWRAHSPERVLNEIQWLVNLDTHEIFFEDDNIAISKDRFVAILEGVIMNRWDLELRAHNGLHVSTATPEILKLMKLAGFKRIGISPESGNERVAKEEMNKSFSPSDAMEAAKNILKEGMYPIVNLIIGMPNETWAEIMDTINYAYEMRDLGVKSFQIAIARPFVGTAMYNDLIAQGRIDDKLPKVFNYYVSSFDGLDWKAQDVFDLRNKVVKEINSEWSK